MSHWPISMSMKAPPTPAHPQKKRLAVKVSPGCVLLLVSMAARQLQNRPTRSPETNPHTSGRASGKNSTSRTARQPTMIWIHLSARRMTCASRLLIRFAVAVTVCSYGVITEGDPVVRHGRAVPSGLGSLRSFPLLPATVLLSVIGRALRCR